MSGYIGVQPVPQTTQTRDSFTATANQTSFGTSGYQVGFLDVYLNGVKLAAADFTATNGSDVVLATGAALNDILEVVAFSTFSTSNGTFTGTTTFDTVVVTNTVDGRDVSVDGAKLDTIPVISTSSTASFIAKGDGSSQDGYIQLNCSQNSHGIKIKSPPHSANASYTLTFPNDDGTANQLLSTDGSGVLSWATVSSSDSTKLPLAGGAMTGAITTNSTFDGRDVAADGVLATNALPKSGGAMTGAITTNSTFDGRDVAADGVLATNALPKAGGTISGNLVVSGNISGDTWYTGVGSQGIFNTNTNDFAIKAQSNDTHVYMANNGAVTLYHDNTAKFATSSGGVTVTGTLNASGLSYVNSGNGSGVALKIGGEGGGGLKTQYILASGHTNYQIGVATHAASMFSITPSTSAGNTTFTNPALNIDASGNVGIGNTVFTSARVTAPHLVVGSGSNSPGLTLYGAANSQGSINFADSTSGTASYDGGLIYAYGSGSPNMTFHVNGGTERMRIDSTGAMMVGTTTSRPAEFSHPDGFAVRADVKGQIQNTVTNANCGVFNRDGSDGEIFQFRKDGNAVGKIGVESSDNLSIGGTTANHSGLLFGTNSIIPMQAGSGSNATQDLGNSGSQFKDLYLSGGVVFGPASASSVTSQTLDSYEEGYYTATISPYSGSITLNTSYNTAAYTKVGRSVTVTGLLVASAISSPSGYLEISLPFASANLVEGSERSTNVVTFWCNGTGVPNGSVWYNAMLILNLGGVSYLRVYMQGYNGAYQTSPANWIGAGSDMHINFTYFTA
jgi:hypothetical protein